jgi:hypothetical protein
MPTIVITAQVEDSAKWETGFRTHGALFKKYTATALNFTATDANEVAIHLEVKDLDKFLELIESPETVKAMSADGVKRETVKVFVLNRQFDLQVPPRLASSR